MKQNYTDYSQSVYASIKAGESKYKVKPSGIEKITRLSIAQYRKGFQNGFFRGYKAGLSASHINITC